MSEMRRAARALVEARSERFESRHDFETSRSRLAHALARARVGDDGTYTMSWHTQDGLTVLEATFPPSRRTRAILQGLSAVMLALVATSAWLLTHRDEGAARFLVPLFTLLAVLALPLLTLGMASAKLAHEARIRKAIRVALLDEDEAFPPRQKWPDED